MVELRWLVSFCAVARTGSLTSAALELSYSQPTVSLHLAQLERCLGGELLDRGTRPLQLTPLGVRLLPHARVVVSELGSIMERVPGPVP